MPDLEDFQGAWRIDRRIEDARAGTIAHFDGTACFNADGAGLILDESGTLSLTEQRPILASRRYLWQAGPDGIAVHFADGRFFHDIGRGIAPKARHDCPPDIYEVIYDFAMWPEWHATWRVRGPRKNYVIHSRYLDRAAI